MSERLAILTTYSCIVYPEDGRPSFTLPNCSPRRTDEDSSRNESDEMSLNHVANINSIRAISQLPANSSPEASDEQKDVILSGSRSVAHNAAAYSCPSYFGNFCVGDNIILRCHKGIGQPRNCNNNLAGAPSRGNAYSPCWETSPTSGDAACSKK